MWLPVKSRESY
uniref:Uncharacterized protein n=1 Tax=Arundo donax TaxID=35708 RepID=A0A0A9ES57_ARUDO